MFRNLALAAIAAVALLSAGSASAVTFTTFCESAGAPNIAGGAHPGRCSTGDIDAGNNITSYNAGSFGPGEGLIFKGYGDDRDLDTWVFTATTTFFGALDLFRYGNLGPNTGVLAARLTDYLGNVINLTSATAPLFLGFQAGGTYSLEVFGLRTNIYEYDLRVQAVPVPAAFGLLAAALAGLGVLAARRRAAA